MTYAGTWPAHLRAPGMWVRPGRLKTAILLPYGGTNRANVEYLKSLRLRVEKGQHGSWLITRGRTDELRIELLERYGRLMVVIDVATQRFCTTGCQAGNPERALQCECVCGGENHGGGMGWTQQVGDLLIDTEYKRRTWRLP